jgi:hypothetical protein
VIRARRAREAEHLSAFREERLRVVGDGREEEVKEEEPQVKPSSPRHFREENTAICESGQCACLVIALPCPSAIQILGRR